MNDRKARASLDRARLGRVFIIGSIIVFVGGLWLATFIYTDIGAFCMFLGVMPLSLLLFCTGHLFSDADQKDPPTVEVKVNCIGIDNKAFIAQFFKSMSIEK